MISAVIFDMDGLLIDSEPLWYLAEEYAFETVGVKLSKDDMRSTMGFRTDEIVRHWYNERPWKGTSQKEVEDLIVDKLIEIVRSEGIALPGVNGILRYFKAKSLPMAIASSSSGKIIDAVVDKLNVRDFFEHTYSAKNETHGKPHPGVFITTASLLDVPPQRCLVFEDSPSGVLAAKAAKMKCIAVPDIEHRNHKSIQIADFVINSLNDFDEVMLNSL
jgi:HAD superfamily hydrolase (TIGR01509 family)